MCKWIDLARKKRDGLQLQTNYTCTIAKLAPQVPTVLLTVEYGVMANTVGRKADQGPALRLGGD